MTENHASRTGFSAEELARAREAAQSVAEELVGKRRGERRRRRKRSRHRVLRDLRESERHLLHAGHRMARALDAGLETYGARSAESRRERGEVEAFVLAPVHALHGAARVVEESAGIPADLARALDSRTFRRVARIILLPPLGRGRRG